MSPEASVIAAFVFYSIVFTPLGLILGLIGIQMNNAARRRTKAAAAAAAVPAPPRPSPLVWTARRLPLSWRARIMLALLGAVVIANMIGSIAKMTGA